MRVLLTESAPGAADETEKRLREAGADISLCHPDHRADQDGCVVLRGIGRCPLRTDPDIGLVMDVRAPDAPALPTAREFGACCALRNHVPLVVTGPAVTNRFAWSETTAICGIEKNTGGAGRVTHPADEAIRLDATRAARRALQAAGYRGYVDVAIGHGAGATAVFLHFLGLSDSIARAEAAGQVREALSSREDHAEHGEAVTVVTVPQS